MKRVKMFMSRVVALALLCFFSAPMVQAQGLLDDTTHQVKLSGSFAVLVPGSGFSMIRESEIFPVVLRSTGANVDTGGFDYDINLLTDTPQPGLVCQEDTIGTFSTYAGENEAIGELDFVDFPELEGLVFVGRFFSQVKTTTGKTAFKSVAGWFEIVPGAPSDPIGISKKLKLKAKEKTPEKLGLQCTLP